MERFPVVQKVSVEIVDDLDGGIAAQTVPFGLDGVSYEIDLSDENAQALRDELAPYVRAARRTGGRRTRWVANSAGTGGSVSTSTADRARNQEVRAWAAANGFAVSARGRISREVCEAFEAGEVAAAEEAEQPSAKRAPRRRKTAKS
jgi:hypothetical protein